MKLVQLATEVGLHPDYLMNSLRVAALQGELTSHSLASSAAQGTFNPYVEAILEDISDIEDIPLEKLRGWLVRQATSCPSPRPRAGTPSQRMTPSPTCGAAFSPRANCGSPDAGQRGSFASIRQGVSFSSRATPSPTAAASMASMGPVLPSGNDEVIRAFGHKEQDAGNSMKSNGSGAWRSCSNAKIQQDAMSNSPGRRKGSGDGRRRGNTANGAGKGSASDARW